MSISKVCERKNFTITNRGKKGYEVKAYHILDTDRKRVVAFDICDTLAEVAQFLKTINY